MVSMIFVPYGINPNFDIVPRVMVTSLRIKGKSSQTNNALNGSSSFIDCYGTVESNRADSTILSAYDSVSPSSGNLSKSSRFDQGYQEIYAITNLSTFGRQLECRNSLDLIKTAKVFPRTNPNFRNFTSKSSSLFSQSENDSELVGDSYCKNLSFNVK
ncbi:hypothetical protein BpHYR1_006139 [Brachionus plicatilis]|uniref:Uncharacterized protein n=1 Tax=Brachionus plicatilis TaxID=10195 RepID=A0A3M7RWD6_BRAPC|nr:hypothetical protein BpHYR1_006139 [Brachionus plicatilis]